MNDTIMARLSIRIHLILCGLLFSISSYSTFPDKGRLYKTLDSLLSIQPQITQEKEERINFIREALKGPQVSDETRYQINLRLFDEYLAFRFDSAYKCIQECITIQERAGNQQQLQYCQLVCLNHLEQIVRALGIDGTINTTCSWIYRPMKKIQTDKEADEELKHGAQIDLLIDRSIYYKHTI